MSQESMQVACTPDPDFYGGNIALHVDAYKQDGSWIRLQPVQAPHPFSSITVQTSGDAVVEIFALHSLLEELRSACMTTKLC